MMYVTRRSTYTMLNLMDVRSLLVVLVMLLLILFLTVPSGPPQAVVANVIDLRNLYIVWDPPPAEDQNGIIISYVVNVTGVETGEQIQLTSHSESVEVTALTPNTTYFCIIAASTVVGTGPFSRSVSVQTLETGTHLNLAVRTVTCYSIVMTITQFSYIADTSVVALQLRY